MKIDDIVFNVIDYLNEHNVPYMVVGSLATNVYCVPRSTEDGDIVVDSSITNLAHLLRKKYSDISFDPQVAFESVTATRKIVLSTQGSGFEVELFQVGNDEHDVERFSRRRQIRTMGRGMWLASLEDMIVTKLRWSQHAGREKDIADARNLIAVQYENVEWAYVEQWCDRHGTRPLLERLRQEVQASFPS
ncbi:MAG: hypothetical protein IT425_00425 [Pirellulales bacterium]|nr:hypothetical protein [Pirellulales bacterium]